jgi:pyridoxamine--pyruvate transaminase
MRDPDFTLSAGPVAASPRVLAALGSPLLYHSDPVFQARFRGTEQKLRQVFRTRNDILLMQGEAVLGLEAAARALVRPGAQVLNLVQGVFGKGMGYWLNDFGAELHELEVPYNEAVDPGAVEAYLDQHPDIELVTVVHSETPSGTFCDVATSAPLPASTAPSRSSTASLRSAGCASRWTTGSSTFASPARRSASAGRPG